MTHFTKTLQVILDAVPRLGVERVALPSALGRVLAEDVAAPWDMPHFDHAARDGFALRTADCPHPGTTLQITGFVPAGASLVTTVRSGCAVRILTGAPLPQGCDAVVPAEETVTAGGRVTIRTPVRPRQHIRFRGEEVAGGELLLAAGTVIQSPEIGALASCGKAVVPVYQKARVAVLCSGDELVELGETPPPGRIVNSNAHYLAAALRESGAEPVILSIARDRRESLREQLRAGLQADVLLTAAGVAAGERDLVRSVLAELGVRQLLWKQAIERGGPKAFGMKGRTPVLSLPGNPGSALVVFEEIVRPALLKMMGHRRVLRPNLKATLAQEVRKKPGRVHCLAVRLQREGDRYVAITAGNHRNCRLPDLLGANAIALLPEEPSLVAAGEEVEVHLLRGAFALLEEPDRLSVGEHTAVPAPEEEKNQVGRSMPAPYATGRLRALGGRGGEGFDACL